MKFHPFDRYSAFTDVTALKEASSKPLRKSMRVNLLKSSPEAFKKYAAEKKWMIEPVAWCSEGFFVDRVDREEALGKDLLHILGHVYMQEASSMLPVALLNPQPGDNVLDMSAAPGSKTTQIASQMGRGLPPEALPRGAKGGVIIANDVQEKRLWALATNLQRCSVENVIMTRKVGQWFGKNMTGRFDCVLCDAPCTAQGTVRKDSDALDFGSMENTERMSRLQKDLLESAIHAAKIGGRIVYSTCTLTPEENEEVIGEMLNRFEGKVEVIDPRGEDLGQGTWDIGTAIQDSIVVQQSLSPKSKSLSPASHFPSLRLWPQTFDTEGFFACLLRKTASTRDRSDIEQSEPLGSAIFPGSRQKSLRESLEQWYGHAFVDRDSELLFEAKNNLWITTQKVADFKLPTRPYLVGMPFGKAVEGGIIRIAQEVVTLKGHLATAQVVRISHQEMRNLLKGQNVQAHEKDLQNGDVILCLGDIPICRGLLKDGLILNRLPREIVQMYA